MSNPFYKSHGPLKISDIVKTLNINIKNSHLEKEIYDIKDLLSSTDHDITFFHSNKYKSLAQKTKASFCITTDALKNELPQS